MGTLEFCLVLVGLFLLWILLGLVGDVGFWLFGYGLWYFRCFAGLFSVVVRLGFQGSGLVVVGVLVWLLVVCGRGLDWCCCLLLWFG